MPSTTSLINKLRTDFPAFIFTPDSEFRWSPSDQVIFYDETSTDTASLLHELSHAILGHTSYSRDIELIEIERDAWEHTKTINGPTYEVTIDEDTIEDALDTYRDWLHARSICPTCQATGIQRKKQLYACVACRGQWRVNDARICALRRYKIAK